MGALGCLGGERGNCKPVWLGWARGGARSDRILRTGAVGVGVISEREGLEGEKRVHGCGWTPSSFALGVEGGHCCGSAPMGLW